MVAGVDRGPVEQDPNQPIRAERAPRELFVERVNAWYDQRDQCATHPADGELRKQWEATESELTTLLLNNPSVVAPEIFAANSQSLSSEEQARVLGLVLFFPRDLKGVDWPVVPGLPKNHYNYMGAIVPQQSIVGMELLADAVFKYSAGSSPNWQEIKGYLSYSGRVDGAMATIKGFSGESRFNEELIQATLQMLLQRPVVDPNSGEVGSFSDVWQWQPAPVEVEEPMRADGEPQSPPVLNEQLPAPVASNEAHAVAPVEPVVRQIEEPIVEIESLESVLERLKHVDSVEDVQLDGPDGTVKSEVEDNRFVTIDLATEDYEAVRRSHFPDELKPFAELGYSSRQELYRRLLQICQTINNPSVDDAYKLRIQPQGQLFLGRVATPEEAAEKYLGLEKQYGPFLKRYYDVLYVNLQLKMLSEQTAKSESVTEKIASLEKKRQKINGIIHRLVRQVPYGANIITAEGKGSYEDWTHGLGGPEKLD